MGVLRRHLYSDEKCGEWGNASKCGIGVFGAKGDLVTKGIAEDGSGVRIFV